MLFRAILHLSIYPQELKTGTQKVHVYEMFITALFEIAKR